MPHRRAPKIAVALHDVEPATFERCALIRDWLADHGIERVTLLVIPARDLHPLGERSPEMTEWLRACRQAGDSIAQHGFQHQQLRGASAREFVGLDDNETRRALEAGWRVLKLAGLEPDGFVAPAYAYTPALRHILPRRFRWWAGLLRLHHASPAAARDGAPRLSPAWGTGGEHPWQRLLSPTLIRLGSLLCGETLRVDVHPASLQHPRQMLALEWVLARGAPRREAVTYEQLLGGPDIETNVRTRLHDVMQF